MFCLHPRCFPVSAKRQKFIIKSGRSALRKSQKHDQSKERQQILYSSIGINKSSIGLKQTTPLFIFKKKAVNISKETRTARATTLCTKNNAGSGEREKRAVGKPWRAASCRPICLDTQCPACTSKTGCRGWGCKQSRPLPRAVRCQSLSALFPHRRGASCKYGETISKDGGFMSENKNITT